MTACQCAGGQPECQSWCLCPGSGPHRFQLEVQVHDCVMVVLEQQDAVHLLVPEPSGGPPAAREGGCVGPARGIRGAGAEVAAMQSTSASL